MSSIPINNDEYDEMPDSIGIFGTTLTNPIPVNGINGQIRYLSSLRTAQGDQLFFHRLGSVEINDIKGAIDLFEIVSVENENWGLLYLHMYNSSNSNKAPNGFQLDYNNSISKNYPVGLGSTNYINLFPNMIFMFLNQEYKNFNIDLNGIADKYLQKNNFIRTSKHILQLLETECVATFYSKLVKNSASYPIPFFFSLLETESIKGNLFALSCLQRFEEGDGTEELFRLISTLCYKRKDLGIITESIKVIEKIEPEIHEYCNGWLEMLEIPNTSELVSRMIQIPDNIKTNYLSVPYLYMIGNHKNAQKDLIEMSVSKISSIIF